jgi:hypothetical protein
MEDENDIDKLFRQGLKDPEIPFNEQDWEGMERKLDGNKPKRLVPVWILTAGSIAALLIIFMFWYFFTPNSEISKDKSNTYANKKALPSGSESSSNTVSLEKKRLNPEKERIDSLTERLNSKQLEIHNEEADSRKQQLNSKTEQFNPGKGLVNSPKVQLNSQTKQLNPFNAQPNSLTEKLGLQKQLLNSQLAHPKPDSQTRNLSDIEKDKIVKDRPDLKQSEIAVTGQKAPNKIVDIPLSTSAPVGKSTELSGSDKSSTTAVDKSVPNKNSDYAKLEANIRRKMEASFNKRRGFTLSLMAAPDVTTAQSSKSSKLSSNVGMLVTYALNSKFSVTSGAVYSKKFYNSVGIAAQSNSYASKPWEVDADCNVLDIPLNVNYKLFHKKNIAVSVNTGLSSYLMLKEKYDYITGEPGTVQQRSTLEIRNENQHLFGIANVSVSVDRKITRTVSIGLQPFMKIPLTGIGNGKVDLKSTGLSFSVNLGLFPNKKQEKNALNKY